MGLGGQRHAPAAFTSGKDPVPIVQEAGWAPGPVWMGAENLVPTAIRSPDLPARNKSLYRLCYPGPCEYINKHKLISWCHQLPEDCEHMLKHIGKLICTNNLQMMS
jgi:hypothetical protein